MALRAGYYGLKKKFIDKVNKWDQIVFPRSEQAILGAYNLMGWGLKAQWSSSDGSYNNNSTHSGCTNKLAVNPGDTFICSRKSIVGSGGGYNMVVRKWKTDGTFDGSSNVLMGNILKSVYTVPEGVGYVAFVQFDNSTDVYTQETQDTNEYSVIYDQIIGPTYTPYSKTNQELTASAADQKTAINAIITAATSAADFAAFKTAMGAITPVTRSLSLAAAPEEIVKDEIEEPVVEKKTTKKKSTAKADTTEEV